MKDILEPADKPRIQVVYMTKPSRKIFLEVPYLGKIALTRQDAIELNKELYHALSATAIQQEVNPKFRYCAYCEKQLFAQIDKPVYFKNGVPFCNPFCAQCYGMAEE